MAFLSKISSFSVGFLFSGVLSFTILESIRDRRCLYIKDKNNDKIQQLIYSAKLKELINSAEIQQYRMNNLETQLVEKSRTFTRFFLLNYQTAAKYFNENISQYLSIEFVKKMISNSGSSSSSSSSSNENYFKCVDYPTQCFYHNNTSRYCTCSLIQESSRPSPFALSSRNHHPLLSHQVPPGLSIALISTTQA